MGTLEYAFLGDGAIHNSEQFGATVRYFRKKRGFTQQQLADVCGCSIMFISNLERGKSTAELDLSLRVINTLSVDLCASDRTEGSGPTW